MRSAGLLLGRSLEARLRGVLAALRVESGLGLVEAVIAMTIFIIASTALSDVLTSSVNAHGFALQQTLAQEAADAQIENIRALPYDSVGTSGGNPPGSIAVTQSTASVGVTGLAGTISTDVNYVGDGVPGSYNQLTNYKQVIVKVTRNSDSRQLAAEMTYIAPPARAPYGGINQVALGVNVLDVGTGLGPLTNVPIALQTGPSAPRGDTTDANGHVLFAGLTANPTSGPTAFYNVAATLPTGYQEMTGDTTQVQLAPGQIGSVTMNVYKPATINVNLWTDTTETTAYTGSTTVTLTPPTGPPQTYTITGGSGSIPNLIPDRLYTLTASTPTGLVSDDIQQQVPDAGYPAVTTSTVDLPLYSPPHVSSVALAGTSPTNASSLSWTVTFDTPVSGLTPANFTLPAVGLGGTPTITSVTSSGPAPSATWTVTATDGTGSGTLGLNLASRTGVLDANGHKLANTMVGALYTIDRTPPTVSSIVLASPSPTNAGTVSWTVTFSENVNGVGVGNFGLVKTGLGGTPAITGVTGAAGGSTYTVTASTGTGSGTLGLNLTTIGSIADLVGNAFSSSLPVTGQVYTLDRTAPTVTSINLAGSSPTNAASVSWTVTFSEPVTGVTAASFTDNPSNIFAGSVITGITGSGTTWTVTVSTGSANGTIQLNLTSAGSIVDLVGNALSNTLNGQTYTIDVTPPTVVVTKVNGTVRTFPYTTNATVTSLGGTCTAASGDLTTIGVTVNGSNANPATTTCSAGTWNLTLTTTLSASNTYSIVASQSDNAGNTDTDTESVVVDKVAPTVSGVSSPTTNGTYGIGTTIPVTVTFSEPVYVTGTPQLTLALAPNVAVNYTSGSGTNVLTFNYTVASPDTSSDLNYAATSSLTLNGGTIIDLATNAATLTLPLTTSGSSLGGSKALVIDTTPPNVALTKVNGTTRTFPYTTNATVTSVGGTCTTATGDLAPISVTINGSNANPATTNCSGGTWSLTLTTTLSASNLYNIAASQSDSVANTDTDTESVTVDKIAPTVSSVTSTKADGSYGPGTLIPVTVTFSEPVTVTGTPQLTLALAPNRAINYASGSGTNVLTFNYTVASPDTSSDLDYAATTSLALNGGTITDLAGNAGTLTLPATGSGSSLGGSKALVIDTTPPTVSGVTSSTANGTYGVGTSIPITVTFSEPVTVTGTPQLTLALAPNRAVNYTSGSGTNVLTFNYTVASPDTSSDLNYAATTSLALNGGTISDPVGNAATLTLPATASGSSLGGSKALVIDTTPPTVAITKVNGTTRTFPYTTNATVTSLGGTCTTATGDSTTIGVKINGSNANPATATCSAGAWTLTLTTTLSAANTYSIVASQSDSAGNTGSDTESVVIDTTPPTVTSVNLAGTSPTNAASVSWTVTFSKSVTGVASGNFTLANTGLGGTPAITSVTGSGTTWTVTASSGSGTGTLGLNLTTKTGITDTAGNVLSNTLTGQVYTVDHTAPSASAVSATPSPQNGKPDSGDQIVLTYSEVMDPASIKSGWDGTSTAVTVSFSRTTGTTSAVVTGVNLGTLDLGDSGSTHYLPNNQSNKTETATMVMATVAGKSVVTLTLTSTNATLTALSPTTTTLKLTWTPSSSATDLAGNAETTTALQQTTAAKNF